MADGTHKIGDDVTVTITAANAEAGLTLSSALFNGQTLTNFTDLGNGVYSAIYTVVEGDADVADTDNVITNLVLSDAAGNVGVAVTSVTLAGESIDANRPTILNVSVADGTHKIGDDVTVTITAANAEAGLTLSSALFNGQTLTNFTDLGNGVYSAIYTVVEGDADVADTANVITNLVLSDAAGNVGVAVTSVTLAGESIDANRPTILNVESTYDFKRQCGRWHSQNW